MNSTHNDKRPLPMVEPKFQAHIGRQLRQLYDRMVSEPVPDRFKALLDQLESGEQRPGTADAVASTGTDIPPEPSEGQR
ncbi:MAG: NepR family anti-sigma factor [Ancalomicrobiaceae bacterium]|nr:NepR family anti-sigma factor [Ancalomicrobiaceae bacterium]